MSTEQQLKEENARLKAEVDALKLGSLLSAVDVLQFINLKAEVERLTEDNRQLKKAFEIAEGIIKRMGNAAENAAKEGKQP